MWVIIDHPFWKSIFFFCVQPCREGCLLPMIPSDQFFAKNLWFAGCSRMLATAVICSICCFLGSVVDLHGSKPCQDREKSIDGIHVPRWAKMGKDGTDMHRFRHDTLIWWFPEIGVPPVIMNFRRIFPYPSSVFGVPPWRRWKPPSGGLMASDTEDIARIILRPASITWGVITTPTRCAQEWWMACHKPPHVWWFFWWFTMVKIMVNNWWLIIVNG